jgi:hypothetical protein
MLAAYFFNSIAFINMLMAGSVLTGLAIGLGLVVIGLIRSKTNRSFLFNRCSLWRWIHHG